jgi:hypothetical protein
MVLLKEILGGRCGGGGVLYGPGGIGEVLFFWNLGISLNNKEEAYALLHGLDRVKYHQIS